MADRSKLAAERMAVSVVRAGLTLSTDRVAFRALDGTVLVLLEADSEDDARALCIEHGFEFVALCED